MDPLAQAHVDAIARLTAPGAPFEIAPLAADGTVYRAYRNAPADLGAVYEGAMRHGAAEFLVYEGERWSFESLFARAAELAAAMRAEGVVAGDRVAIAMRNYPEWMAAFIAITGSGAVAVPLNSWQSGAELAFALADCGARLVFADAARAQALAAMPGAHGASLVMARAGELPAGARSIDSFVAAHAGSAWQRVALDPEQPALLMYTSGTTGAAKGLLSTHRAVCQAIANFECAGAAAAMTNPDAIAAMMQAGFAPAHMLAVPLFHVSGCHAVFLTALKAGRRIVMMYKWEVARALELIESERVTILSAAPAMLKQLLESPLLESTDTTSLASLGLGGSATPPRTTQMLFERFPAGYAGTGWGMTESNGIGSAFTGKAFRARPGSAGFVHPTVELSVRDEHGRELPPGEPGMLWLRSPTLASGYWRKPDASARDFVDGWYDSGDIGYLDEGFLYLTDRAKDLVIRGGENIYPAEIEAVLHDCPGVAEVAAFGVPDAAMGEELAVAVVPAAGAALDAEGLRAFAAARLAHFKVPRHVLLRAEALPRNAAGKVLKKALREGFTAGRDGA